jgi:hypothetical protein
MTYIDDNSAKEIANSLRELFFEKGPAMELAVQIALPIICLLGGWLFKVVFDRIKTNEETNRDLARLLNDLRVELPTIYTRRTDLKEVGDNIFDAIHELGSDMKEGMRRLEVKIDGKVDRHEMARKE